MKFFSSRLFLGRALIYGAMVCVQGCSSSPEPIAVEDFVSAICQVKLDCGRYPSVDSCLEVNPGVYGQVLEDVSAGLISYRPEHAAACIADLFNASCESGYSGDPYSFFTGHCADAFRGTIPIGGQCFSTASCAGLAYCEGTSNIRTCTAGTCVEFDLLPEVGSDCEFYSCGAHLRCDVDTRKCREPFGPGESCTQSFGSCVQGYFCTVTASEAGTCVKRPGTGGQCDIGEALGRDICAKSTDYCDLTTGLCTRRGTVGDRCDDSADSCLELADCVDGQCMARPLLGETCEKPSGPECIYPLHCASETGTCSNSSSPPDVCTL